ACFRRSGAWCASLRENRRLRHQFHIHGSTSQLDPGTRSGNIVFESFLEVFMEGVGWFATIIIGIIAGWIAERVHGRNHGLITNLIVGLIGALLGGWLAQVAGIVYSGWWASLL